MMESDEDMNKYVFKSNLLDSVKNDHQISDEEINLLFDVLDTSSDGVLQRHDVYPVPKDGSQSKI